MVETEELVCWAGSYLHLICVNEGTCHSLCAEDEDISEGYFAEEDRAFEEEGDGVDHEGEGDLDW